MAIQSGQRTAYLQALGIDVWVPRNAVPVDAVAVGEQQEQPAPVQEAPAAAPVARAPAAEVPAPATFPQPVAGPVPQQAPRQAPRQVPHTVSLARSLAGPPAVPPPAVDAATEAQWERLRAEVLACTKCPLHTTRTQGVFGVGNRQAQWLVIGEAPGEDEDLKGEPFVGRAGQLLDSMLRSIGLSRDSNVYIANVLKSRPPGNRTPSPAEAAACLPYLERQVALVRPKLMLAVGRIAAQNLLGTDAPLGRLRGKVHPFGELNIPLIVTYHPAYLLRSPAEKRKAWEDLRFAREHFRQLTNGSFDGHRS